MAVSLIKNSKKTFVNRKNLSYGNTRIKDMENLLQ